MHIGTIVVNTPLGRREIEIVGRCKTGFHRAGRGTLPMDTWVCAGAYRETRVSDMTWNDAVEILAGSKTNEYRGEAIALVVNHLRAKMSDADMCDWVANGNWNGNETIEQIQAELRE